MFEEGMQLWLALLVYSTVKHILLDGAPYHPECMVEI